MAHNLATTAGQAAMMYRGAAPWHKLGTKVEGILHAAEAIQAAGLAWGVNLDDVYRMDAGGFKAIPGRRVIVREDNGTPFGIVSQDYRPIQNADAFTFFDEIVKDGLADYETAGALGGGERIWIMAKMPGGFTLPGSADETRPYALLTTTHDGTGACRIMFTAVRVVCQNTLNAATGNGRAKSAWSIRHTGNTAAALTDARIAFQESQGIFRTFQRQAEALADRPFSDDSLKSFLLELVPNNAKADNNARTENIRTEIRHLVYNGKGNNAEGVRGSWWAALNGVTEYVDHSRSARGGDTTAKTESRFDSATFGSGARLKQQALETALQMSGAASALGL